MSHSLSSHHGFAWAKQKLDEVATIAQIENSTDALRSEARPAADQVIKCLKDSRERLQSWIDTVRVEGESLNADAQAVLRRDWIETEASVQSFLTAISADIELVRKVISARVYAEQKSLQDLLDSLHLLTSTALDKARGEFDLSLDRLSQETERDLLNSPHSSTSTAFDKALSEFDLSLERFSQETEKLQARLGNAASAEDEFWKAMKAGFAEIKVIHDRTVKKIADILARVS